MEDQSNVVVLGDEDKNYVLSTAQFTNELRRRIGVLRTEYLSKESNLFRNILKTEQDLISQLRLIATNMGLNPDDWEFDYNSMTFVRKIENG